MSEYGYLMHHGVKGMRWGVRNYQNADGSLTAEGRARYYNADGTRTKAGTRYEAKQYAAQTKAAYKEAKAKAFSFKKNGIAYTKENGYKAWRSEMKNLRNDVKNTRRDAFVAGNKFNTSKYKLKYRDADAATKVKMARANKIKTAVTAYATQQAVKMLVKDTVKAAVATHAQKGQQAMSGPQVAALFTKNMGVQLNNRVEKISKVIDTAANIGGSIGKRVGENMAYRKANRPTKKGFGSYREVPWGYLPGK